MTLVQIDRLTVHYGRRAPVQAVRDVSLTIGTEEFLGLVGESGCGKSTLGFAIARLERSPASIVSGTVMIDGLDWTRKSNEELRALRWSQVAVVLQSGMNALNPVLTIKTQFWDVMAVHTPWSPKEIWRRSEEVLDMVRIPRNTLSRYPHELSGGMKQRVVIAMAMLLRPKLIIMDEPTTALDMIVQRAIVDNLKILRLEQKFSVLFISHDLGLVLELADRVLVMYAGKVVESQSSSDIFHRPLHPYTRGLLRSLPNPSVDIGAFEGIPGSPPDLRTPPVGCAFAERCPLVEDQCRSVDPPPVQRGSAAVRCHVTNKEIYDARSRA